VTEWKDKLAKQSQEKSKSTKKEESLTEKQAPLTDFVGAGKPQPTVPEITSPRFDMPDYLKENQDEDSMIKTPPPSPALPRKKHSLRVELASSFDAPKTGWLSSDKLRVISYMVFGSTSRQRIDKIEPDLARVFLATSPPDEAKRIAQAFLQFLEQRETIDQRSPQSR
jgi:hypothetical protein